MRSFNTSRTRGLARRPGLAMGGCFGLIVAVIVVGAIAFAALGYWNDESVTFTVTEKGSVATGHGDDRGHEYRIYTDKGTFVVKDSLLKMRFDSADEYGRLKTGERYTCEAFGFRIPVFSSFKNLHNCHPA